VVGAFWREEAMSGDRRARATRERKKPARATHERWIPARATHERWIPARATHERWTKVVLAIRTLAAVGCVCLAGCATSTALTVYPALSSQETEERLLHRSDVVAAPDVDVLALSPEIEAWIAKEFRNKSTTQLRLQFLTRAFAPDGALHLEYDTRGNYPARETFERRAGNCLAFTHLFIAMARELNLDSHYREIPGRPSWESVGDFVVVNRHIVAYGNVAGLADYTADFGNIATGDDAQYGIQVSDDRARAQHFNNLGARAITDGDSERGLALIKRALLIDPKLAFVWTNLGTAYMRVGRYQDAEAALLQALRLDRFEVTAINQTQHLYERLGRDELASFYLRRAERARYQNPYARFWQGIAAMENGNLDSAAGYLRRAVNDVPQELQFRLQLARVYARLGKAEQSLEEMQVAAGLVQSADDERSLQRVQQDIEAVTTVQ
jgi:tetratricopeptide (TPR) repeat protein